MRGRGCRLGAGLVALALATVGLSAAPAGAAPRAPRIVSLSFDDERVSQGVAGDLLAARHLHGTFFVISRSVNTGDDPESMTWAQIHRLALQGNEIGGHTRTHPHLPTLDRDDQTAQICGGRQDLLARGYHPTVFAYPYGEFNATSEAVVRRCGFALGRAAWGGPETLPPADRYAVRTLRNVKASDTVAGLEAQTTEAKPGQWLNYVFHDIGPPTHGPGADDYRIATKDFTALLDWLVRQRRAGTVVVRRVGDVVR
jgi:peptidoglycan/xylan/chitin deacetylase (PgdA/CDA1 family)